jgi:hypothetical protein
LGADQQAYKNIINPSPLNERAYELKTNESEDDYSDLVIFINAINNSSPSEFATTIDEVFDVKAYLKVLAAEILLGHWDNYFYNKNNYYLYHRADGKFVYLPYDMDNTLGVQWGVPNIDSRDIYNWGNKLSSQSPLTYKILAVPQFKIYYENFLKQLLNGIYSEQNTFRVLDSIKSQLGPAVAMDPFFNNTVPTDYGYTTAQWEQSYTQAIDGHATFGIKPFISKRRSSALAQLPASTGIPKLNGFSFTLYPNPSNDSWQIETQEVGILFIHDIMGRLQFTQQLSLGKFIFDQNLKSGMYFVTILTAKGSDTQKLRIE